MAITTNSRIRRHRVCFTLSENPIRTVSLNGRGVNLSLDRLEGTDDRLLDRPLESLDAVRNSATMKGVLGRSNWL